MEKYVVKLDDFEKRLMINGLYSFRNDLIAKGKPIEDVNSLLIKLIDAKKQKEKPLREAR